LELNGAVCSSPFRIPIPEQTGGRACDAWVEENTISRPTIDSQDHLYQKLEARPRETTKVCTLLRKAQTLFSISVFYSFLDNLRRI
jgi:hypothetical protein